MAAHEFRTPLTTISGYIQLLYNKLANSKKIESTWIKNLSYENVRLTNLVKELLDINKVKSGQLDFYLKVCNLEKIISRAINNFNFQYPERKLIFKDTCREKTPEVIGDYDKLLQVINNLLDNAAKFSPPNSSITISLKSDKTQYTINVKDQGAGINKEDLPKIFSAFYKGDHQITGMGLGLHLSRYIINYHQGSIHVSSKENQGTTFEINLPRMEL